MMPSTQRTFSHEAAPREPCGRVQVGGWYVDEMHAELKSMHFLVLQEDCFVC